MITKENPNGFPFIIPKKYNYCISDNKPRRRNEDEERKTE